MDQNNSGPQNLINEDELMKNSEQNADKTVQKLCDINDKMVGAKPCANCSCGLAEMVEGNTTKALTAEQVKNLENGNTESACGKCYLGDAFRCAACPFRGKPAFEKGDKVKLVNSDSQQQSENTDSRK